MNTTSPWANDEVAEDLTISGGTVDNSTIGGTTPAAGTFTTMTGESATLTLGKNSDTAQGTIILHDAQSGDDYTTTLQAATAISSSKTITLPDATGFLVTTGDTATVTGTMIANDTIQLADLNDSCAANEIIKRNGGDTAWECAADATGGGGSFSCDTGYSLTHADANTCFKLVTTSQDFTAHAQAARQEGKRLCVVMDVVGSALVSSALSSQYSTGQKYLILGDYYMPAATSTNSQLDYNNGVITYVGDAFTDTQPALYCHY